MWVFLNNAYVSMVQDRDDANFLQVRARLRGDIQAVFPDATVTLTPNADYRFRARIDRADVARAMLAQVLSIDYTNFKKSVPDFSRHSTYLRVWQTMLNAQLDEAYAERRESGPVRLAHLLDMKPRDLPLHFEDEFSRSRTRGTPPRGFRPRS